MTDLKACVGDKVMHKLMSQGGDNSEASFNWSDIIRTIILLFVVILTHLIEDIQRYIEVSINIQPKVQYLMISSNSCGYQSDI